MSAPTRTTGTLDLTVVVPAYNEEERLGPTLDAITGHLRENEAAWGDWEVVVVDDGSTDGTRDLVTGLADPRVQLVTSRRNRGKGHALRLGVPPRAAPASWSRTPISRRRSRSWRSWTRRWPRGTRRRSARVRVPGSTIEHHQHRVRESWAGPATS